ncbi:MAG: ASPIC/UnbV domain-containing protein, partial [Planctomycetota bacterium]
ARSGRAYQSHFGTTLHFGLGHRKKIDRVEIAWLGGQRNTFTDTKPNQTVILTEQH